MPAKYRPAVTTHGDDELDAADRSLLRRMGTILSSRCFLAFAYGPRLERLRGGGRKESYDVVAHASSRSTHVPEEISGDIAVCVASSSSGGGEP